MTDTTHLYTTIQDKIDLLKSHGIDAERNPAGTTVIIRSHGVIVDRAIDIFTEHGIRIYAVHLTVPLDEFNEHRGEGFFQLVTKA